MLTFPQSFRKRGYLLATGQTTSYGSGTGVDDGALKKGIVKAYTILTTGQYSGNTNITINSKTDVHANACVFDNNTGLMWSRTASASVGPASDGKLPWTNTGSGATLEGIFPYCAAANAAGLAGYSDWRVPNKDEVLSICNSQVGHVNSTAWPTFTQDPWSSSTLYYDTTAAYLISLGSSRCTTPAKTGNNYVILVRG